MKYTIKRLEKGAAEIRIELLPEDVRPHLEEAAGRISQSTNIPGFRPGHATYAVVEGRVGAKKIMEEALEPIVRRCFVEIVENEDLSPLGSPGISVGELTPGQPLTITLNITLMPAVTKLADYAPLNIKRNPIEVKEEEVDRVLSRIQNMRAKEIRSKEPVGNNDHVVLDMVISQNGSPIGGGQAAGHHVFMHEPHYLPGFKNQLLSVQEGQTKSFTLEFPKEHYQKSLAGQPLEFKVTVKEVYRRELLPLDDEFAKGLGKPTLAEVRGQLRKNLEEEKNEKEAHRLENAALNEIVRGSSFEDVPDLLVNEAINELRGEMEAAVARQGLEWDQYLQHLGKTEAQLKLDLAPNAIQKIKTLLVMREIAAKEEIRIVPEEVDRELDRVAELYKNDQAARDQIYSPAYREQVTRAIRNRKTMARLKEKMVK